MNWTVASALIGVALGSATTIVTQYLSTRASTDAVKRADARASRGERKAAIMDFVNAAQPAELEIEARYSSGLRDLGDADVLRHNLWVAEKRVRIVCSDAMRHPTWAYAARLAELLNPDLAGEQSLALATMTPFQAIAEVREGYLNAATAELDPKRPARASSK